ncbi:MAG: hypothetical protein AB3N33_09805 [Puniceicoccaceae bacterium]
MERKTSSLLIKSNRVLGTRLVEADLVNVEEMDRANESFIEMARAKDIKRASLLRVLVYDMQSLKEESLLDYQLENYPVGAVMLENYKIDEELLEQESLELMRASWTLPIDKVNGRWFLATAYYMSDIVRDFWEERLEGRVSWYVSSLSQMEAVFESRAEQEAAAAVEAEPVESKA